ncbi:MAG: hypothetical protein WAQ17_09800 [Limnochordia bacterium]
MRTGRRRRQAKLDMEEQLNWPWDWSGAYYRSLDGWEINKNRVERDKYLTEMGRELGLFTSPHRKR